jgi:hypothetical protein
VGEGMKIILDVWDSLNCDESLSGLIILYPTGIYYTDQTAGIACDHPEAEGFLMPIHCEYGFELDCELLCGCFGMNNDNKKRYIEFSKQIDKELEEYFPSLKFDHDELYKTQENWIPVIANININAHDWGRGKESFRNMKGILCNGNCD